MASCSSCNVNVGCGCQLTNGLCAYCYGLTKQAKQKLYHVITQTYKLCRLF